MARLVSAATGALSCGLVAALVVSALSLSTVQARLFFVGVLALLAVGVCLALPVPTLPTLALILTVLVPDRIANYSASPLVTPATVVLSIWIVRKLLTQAVPGRVVRDPLPDPRLRKWLTIAAVLLGALMVVLVVVSPSKRLSGAWTFTFLVAVVVPLLIGDVEEEARRLSRALPWLGVAAAAYAVVQRLIERNVVYSPIYQALGFDELQHWAVYRSDSSLGHPLTAGLFFAVVLAYCTGRWLKSGQYRFAVAALVNGLGIVSTVSRGPYAAAAAGVAVVLLTALKADRHHRFRHLLVLVIFVPAALLAVNSGTFVARGLSAEGLSSVNSRTALPQIAAETARAYHWLGGGPANSLSLAAPFNFQRLPIENSYLQLLIGVGIPGLVLFVVVLLLASVIAVRRRNLAALGALVAYATAISGFAALDSRRNLVVLLGVLVMITMQRFDQEVSPTPSRHAAVRARRAAVLPTHRRYPVIVRSTPPRRRQAPHWEFVRVSDGRHHDASRPAPARVADA